MNQQTNRQGEREREREEVLNVSQQLFSVQGYRPVTDISARQVTRGSWQTTWPDFKVIT